MSKFTHKDPQAAIELQTLNITRSGSVVTFWASDGRRAARLKLNLDDCIKDDEQFYWFDAEELSLNPKTWKKKTKSLVALFANEEQFVELVRQHPSYCSELLCSHERLSYSDAVCKHTRAGSILDFKNRLDSVWPVNFHGEPGNLIGFDPSLLAEFLVELHRFSDYGSVATIAVGSPLTPLTFTALFEIGIEKPCKIEFVLMPVQLQDCNHLINTIEP
jgi:uncharacterized protein YcfL